MRVFPQYLVFNKTLISTLEKQKVGRRRGKRRKREEEKGEGEREEKREGGERGMGRELIVLLVILI